MSLLLVCYKFKIVLLLLQQGFGSVTVYQAHQWYICGSIKKNGKAWKEGGDSCNYIVCSALRPHFSKEN